MPTLQFGSRGKDVKAIQEALNLYFAQVPEYREQFRKQLEWDKVMPAGGPQPLVTDEQFGGQTRAAVEAFQAYKHVKGGADGIVGPNTLAALYPCGAFRIGCVLQQGQPQPRPGLPAWGLHMRPPDERSKPAAPTSGVVVTPQSAPVTIAPTQAPPAAVDLHNAPDVGMVPVPKSLLPDKNKPRTGYLQWKGALNHTFGNWDNKKAYNAIAFDWIGVVLNPHWLDWGSITMGPDLNVTAPLTNHDIAQGANPGVTVYWSVSLAAQHFYLGRYDLLARLAKIGVHLSTTIKLGTTLSGSDPTPKYGLAAGAALQVSYDLIKSQPGKPPNLSLFAQCAGAYSELSVADGFNFSGKGTTSCSLGVSGNVGQ